MFLEERQQQIIDLLDKHGRVTVTELAKQFDVTEDCIRKDLKQLVAEGKCNRVYGGATKIENPTERKVKDRLNQFQPEKQIIAKKAIKLIEPRQSIYLDVSSTNLYLAQLIAQEDIPCTVVSPMVDVLMALSQSSSVTGICPGGTMNAELNGFVGALAIEGLSRFRFDVAFIGASAVNVEDGAVCTYEADDGLVKSYAIGASDKCYLACESRKLGIAGNYRFSQLNAFNALISDGENTEALEEVKAAGYQVL